MIPPTENRVLKKNLLHHLHAIYHDLYDDAALQQSAVELIGLMHLNPTHPPPPAHQNKWDASDIAVISYGDSIVKSGE